MTPHRCIDACNLRVRAKKLTRRDLFVSFRAGNKIFRKGTRWRSREQGEWTDSPEKARVADAAPRAVGARDRRVTHRTTNQSRERTNDGSTERRILDRFDLRAEIKPNTTRRANARHP